MAVTDEQIAFVTDLFADIGPLTNHRMFGGLGVNSLCTIFAVLLSDGTLKLKGIGKMEAAFQNAGWAPWTYTCKDGAASSMPYWTVPDALLDDPDDVCGWARRALHTLHSG